MKRLTRNLVTSAGLTALVAACASVPAPTEQMALARAALSEAEAAGAPTYAGLRYRDAEVNMDAARQALAAGNNAQARRFAEEAALDAQLAARRARAAKADQHIDNGASAADARDDPSAR